jgi:hypothetical protein
MVILGEEGGERRFGMHFRILDIVKIKPKNSPPGSGGVADPPKAEKPGW